MIVVVSPLGHINRPTEAVVIPIIVLHDSLNQAPASDCSLEYQ